MYGVKIIRRGPRGYKPLPTTYIAKATQFPMKQSWFNRETPLYMTASLVPRSHPKEGKGLGTLKHFLAHYHVITRAPIQPYANNYMIAELAKPGFNANVPKPFPRMHGGVWE